jgi:hypothetical protein
MTQRGNTFVTVPEESLPVSDNWFTRLSESERLLLDLTHVDVHTSMLLGVENIADATKFCNSWREVMHNAVENYQTAQRDKLNNAFTALDARPSDFEEVKKAVVPTNEYMADLLGRLGFICSSVIFLLGGKTDKYSENLLRCCASTCAWCLTGRPLADNKYICEKAKTLRNGDEWIEMDNESLTLLSTWKA